MYQREYYLFRIETSGSAEISAGRSADVSKVVSAGSGTLSFHSQIELNSFIKEYDFRLW